MLAAMLLTCPRCAVGLDSEEEESGLTWRCAACGGVSINYSQFRRRVSAWHANRIWERAQEARVPAVPRTACPECRRAMVPAAVESALGATVRVCLCVPCQRLWMETSAPAVEHDDGGGARLTDSRGLRRLR